MTPESSEDDFTVHWSLSVSMFDWRAVNVRPESDSVI